MGLNIKEKLLPPTTYQGGKQRLSKDIIDYIIEVESKEIDFYDLCCGSGAVGLEMISRGIPTTMVDKGVYGAVWQSIGNKEFNIGIFKEEVDKLPEIEGIKDYLYNLSLKPVDKERIVYHYLLLQAGSFGGKQIWVEEDKWYNNSFRSLWKPTATSNRRSVVNPMMPMPKTIIERLEVILTYQEYIKGLHKDIEEFSKEITKKGKQVFYIDPPYMGTTGYKDNFDIDGVVERLRKLGTVYVSEGYHMESATECIELSKGRTKGNISGNRKKEPVKEILNIIK